MLAVEISASPIGLMFAFFGGVISILSPCVLPILPGMMGLISGSSLDEISQSEKLGRKVIKLCALFTLGFSFVYVIIGLATTALSDVFLEHGSTATRVGGVVLIIFSLLFLLTNVFNVSFVSFDKRPFLKEGITDSGTVITGAAFGFGWSPCLGPILAGVLAYASTEHSILLRILIILTYCLGLCFAMSLVIYFSLRSNKVIGFIKRNTRAIMIFTFLIMFSFGVILATNNMVFLTQKLIDFMELIGLRRLVEIG